MTCTNDKFVINQGMVNEFTITIKQNDSTLPMIIDDADTFKVFLYKLEDNSLVSNITMTKSDDGIVEVFDKNNGQILIKLSDILVGSLSSERGTKADKYYLKPLYRLAIECNTKNNGNFVAKIHDVYVDK